MIYLNINSLVQIFGRIRHLAFIKSVPLMAESCAIDFQNESVLVVGETLRAQSCAIDPKVFRH